MTAFFVSHIETSTIVAGMTLLFPPMPFSRKPWPLAFLLASFNQDQSRILLHLVPSSQICPQLFVRLAALASSTFWSLWTYLFESISMPAKLSWPIH